MWTKYHNILNGQVKWFHGICKVLGGWGESIQLA